MSKLLWSGIAIALLGSIGTAQAQLPSGSTTPKPQSQPTSPTSTPLKTTDLPLIKKAVGKFWQTDRAETESQIEIDSSNETEKTKYFISVQTIAQVGRKFRSELTINKVGETSKTKYTIVSDGKNAWIYQPNLSQYAEISTDDFGRDPSAAIVGLSSYFFSSLDEAERQNLTADLSGKPSQMISLENLQLLQLRQQQIDLRDLFIYTYGDEHIDLKIIGFLDPQTVNLERTEIKFGDLEKYEFSEKIVKRNSQVVINRQTFTFSPPKGVEKVISLQIGPFKF
jgi:outer membrane lipoprotein-sorting protein